MNNTQVVGILEYIAMILVLIGFVYLMYKYVIRPAFENEWPAFNNFNIANDSEAAEKGEEGEAIVASLLKTLPSSEYTTLNDILIKVGDRYSQIDHIVISTYGIFVIETKNYAGSIMGREDDNHWKQDIVSMGKSQSYINSKYFYNPVKQNKTHTKVLHQIIEDLVSKNALIPIVVFIEDNPLFLDVISKVTWASKLIEEIKSCRCRLITRGDADAVIRRIKKANLTDKANREAHIRQANKKQEQLSGRRSKSA